jgi:signal transduction histidine kinase
MNKTFSISYKWALILAAMVIILLSLGLLFNNLFFYDYYLYNEKQDILSFSQSIDENYDNPELVAQLIDEFVLKKQASVNLYTEGEGYNFSFSVMAPGNFRGKGNRKNVNLPHGVEIDLTQEGYTFIEYEHDDIKTQLLGLIYRLKNDDTLFVTLPFEGISRSADIAIQFNFYIVLILLALAMIVVVFLAKRMTQPIISLSAMTKRISDLDFSIKYKGNSNDEIHELGLNINEMSDALEDAMIQLKEANEALKRDLLEKEKNVEMRKTLIANVSHELKTPIALVMSYAEGLSQNQMLDSDKKDYYLNVISKEAEHMDTLVRDLLDLTELEYDAFKLEYSTFDMSSLVDELIDRYASLIKEKSLRVELDKEDIIDCYGDKRRMDQAITNLLLNAIEHSPTDGLVSIRIQVNDKVKIFIENSGSHIKDENLDLIWTSFFKSDKRDRKIGGSGIGLSIVKAIVEKHQGSYGVRNTASGVEFYIEI